MPCLLSLVSFLLSSREINTLKDLDTKKVITNECWFLGCLSWLYPKFTFMNADIKNESPTLFPSPTAKADRIDKEWKVWRSFGVCSRGTGSKGRRKCKYSSLITMFEISVSLFFGMQHTSSLDLYYPRRKASLCFNSQFNFIYHLHFKSRLAELHSSSTLKPIDWGNVSIFFLLTNYSNNFTGKLLRRFGEDCCIASFRRSIWMPS